MKCADAEKFLPIFCDNRTPEEDFRDMDYSGSLCKRVKEHVEQCPSCRKELKALKAAWKMLGEWEDVIPRPGFIPNFWRKIAGEGTWLENMQKLSFAWWVKRLVPVATTVCISVFIGLLAAHNYGYLKETRMFLSQIDDGEWEMIDQMELAENFEMLDEIEFLEEWEVIEAMETLDSSNRFGG